MKDRYDSFPMGKDRGESFVLTVGKKKPHERPESCRMSYAKTTILRWRSFVEQAYDTKNQRRWRQDRRTYDKLEAAAMMCFYAHRTRKFRLTRYIKDFAAYFGCSPRTIRRALKDGCYYREEVFGTNVERIAFFSAERMEIKHKAAAKNRGRPDAVAKMDAGTKTVFDKVVGLLMADRFGPGEFRPSPYAALIIARRGYDREVKLPCEKTIRNYAHAEKHGLGKKALRRVGPRRRRVGASGASRRRRSGIRMTIVPRRSGIR